MTDALRPPAATGPHPAGPISAGPMPVPIFRAALPSRAGHVNRPGPARVERGAPVPMPPSRSALAPAVIVGRPARASADPFHAFVDAHSGAVYALAYRLTGDAAAADDLVQDAFVRAWDAFETLREADAARAWLRRITVRLFLNTRRGTLRQRFVRWCDTLVEHAAAPAPDVDATFPAAVERGLAALTERERAAFVLRHLDDRTTAEAARAMGVAEGTVKALLARAVHKMQAHLRPYA